MTENLGFVHSKPIFNLAGASRRWSSRTGKIQYLHAHCERLFLRTYLTRMWNGARCRRARVLICIGEGVVPIDPNFVAVVQDEEIMQD
jgi:hypothetical protein